jgi:hypothetical protein
MAHRKGKSGREAASGETDEADGPIRSCALTRERRPDRELLRFVLDPQGRVTPDIRRKLPGRGVWLTPTRDAVAEAVKRKLFPKAFRGPAETVPDLPAMVGEALAKAALQTLSLANKAGEVVTGFQKLDKQIETGDIAVLLHATDASQDGCGRLDRKLRALSHRHRQPVLVLRPFSSAEMSLALGRANVIHAAVKSAPIAEKFLSDVVRWLIYDGREALPAAVGEDIGIGNQDV